MFKKFFCILLTVLFTLYKSVYGQVNKPKTVNKNFKVEKKPTKEQTVTWILEKLNIYFLNDIVIKCGEGNSYNDQYSDYKASYDFSNNEFIIGYKHTDLNSNYPIVYEYHLRATDFESLKNYDTLPTPRNCSSNGLVVINSNCKCVREFTTPPNGSKFFLWDSENVHIRLNTKSEVNLLDRLTKAFLSLKQIIQNPQGQPY